LGVAVGLDWARQEAAAIQYLLLHCMSVEVQSNGLVIPGAGSISTVGIVLVLLSLVALIQSVRRHRRAIAR